MAIKYKIYPERKLLVDVLKNKVDLKELKEMFIHEISNEKFGSVTRILSVIDKAQFNMTIDEVQEFIRFITIPNPGKVFHWAILTSDPKSTAFSIMIQEDEFFKDVVCVFSTLKASLNYLDIQFKEEELNDADFIVLK